MLNHRRLVLFLAVLMPLTVAAPAFAQSPAFAGHWEGAIEIPTAKLALVLDFAQKPDGSWTGTISIPAQNAKNLALAKVEFKAPDVAFEIPGVPGNPVFKGTLSADGASIQGTFSQGGQSFPFGLKRTETPAAKAKTALAGFDDDVERALKSLNVPGAAIAVVVGDEVVLAKGFGLRDVEAKLPMTADTLMAIGSSTKAFTTFALGTLVDEGRLEWDRPVRTYVPWFKLYDPSATERITPRDLVTHRSGLPRHDLLWYNNLSATREDLVRRLAFLKPTADLREKFQYNNLMFLTAGYLLETLTGKTWEDAVRSRILAPLGMTRTNFSVEESKKDTDFAQPYSEDKGTLKKIPFRNITTVGPAGAINSSANEMSRWVRVHLNGGKLGATPIIGAATLADMHSAHMPMGGTQVSPELTPALYGMGWFNDVYRGHSRVHHGGNIDGFSALVSFLPMDNLGFVVLTNANGTALAELVVRHAIDRILGLPARDWIKEAADAKTKGEAVGQAAEKKKETRRIPKTKPAHPTAEYAGDYSHPGYGNLRVFLRDDKVFFLYNGITTEIAHWHYETFNGRKGDDPTFADTKLTFRTNVNGQVAAVEVPLEPTLEDIVFERLPDARLTDPAFLKKLEGRYDTGTQQLAISLKGSTLVVSVPGQPLFELRPALGGEFVIKQAPSISVVFHFDKEGRVIGADLIQPSGIYEAKRIKD